MFPYDKKMPPKGKEEKKKRQPNAFMCFYSEKRPSIMQENPDLKMTEIAKKAGEMWKELSPEQKLHYKR